MDDFMIIARSVFTKQLTENQLRTLHNKENNRGFRYGAFLLPRMFPDIKQTGILTDEECFSVLEKVNKQIPKIKDTEDNTWLGDLDFLHAWDWNIRNNIEGNFEVGKLAPTKKDLLNKVKPITAVEKEYAESKEQNTEDWTQKY